MEKIKWVSNEMPKTDDKELSVMSIESVKKAKAFHESFPQYSQTPLVKLDKMSEYLGIGSLFVKDESYRFGLNAFKVLGGSFAMARYIAQKLGRDVSELDYDYLTSDKLKEEFGQATFLQLLTVTMDVALRGRLINSDKRQSSICRKAPARFDWKTF